MVMRRYLRRKGGGGGGNRDVAEMRVVAVVVEAVLAGRRCSRSVFPSRYAPCKTLH